MLSSSYFSCAVGSALPDALLLLLSAPAAPAAAPPAPGTPPAPDADEGEAPDAEDEEEDDEALPGTKLAAAELAEVCDWVCKWWEEGEMSVDADVVDSEAVTEWEVVPEGPANAEEDDEDDEEDEGWEAKGRKASGS
jgi:hypothetical protein